MLLNEVFQSKKVLIIFPGGFHLFSPGHLFVYNWLKNNFPIADVYLASSNKVTERPFPFEIKRYLASQAGIPENHFIQVKSPYKADEITKSYDPDNTILIFALSEKDKDRLGKPFKKDGTPSYMQKYPGSLNECKSFNKHGYYIVTPTVKYTLLGQEINSASKIREMYKDADNKTRIELIRELYPESTDIKTIKKYLDQILGNTLTEDYFDDHGFWTGNKGASGILPVCSKTKRICLAWRSKNVQNGNCFGTIGGAVKEDLSPVRSARQELIEETGYTGPMMLYSSYKFTSGTFEYQNFIGVVKEEFGFNPQQDSSWETDFIKWFTFDEIKNNIIKNSNHYHPGLIALFKNSSNQIYELLKKDNILEYKEEQVIDRDGWITNTGKFIPNRVSHEDTLKAFKMTNYEEAYEKGWLHLFTGLEGHAYIGTNQTLKKSSPLIYDVVKKLQKKFPIITFNTYEGLYEWDGRNFNMIRKYHKDIRESVSGKEEYGWFLPNGKYISVWGSKFIDNLSQLPIDARDSHYAVLRSEGLKSYDEAYDKGWIRFSTNDKGNAYLETSQPFEDIEDRLENIARKINKKYSQIFATTGAGKTSKILEWNGKEFILDKNYYKLFEYIKTPIDSAGWITNTGVFLENGLKTHLENLRKHGMKTYDQAYSKRWLHLYTTRGYAYIDTDLKLDDVYDQLVNAALRLQNSFHSIEVDCSDGRYYWDGNDFRLKTRFINESISAGNLENGGWLLPNGEFLVNVDYKMGHYDTLEKLGMKNYFEALDKGWIHVSSYGLNGLYFWSNFPMEKIRNRIESIAKKFQKYFDNIQSGTQEAKDSRIYKKWIWNGKEFISENKLVTEHIVKLKNGKFRLLSHKGKNLGTFDSRKAAEKHEGEVNYFKNLKESKIFERLGPHNGREADMLIDGVKPAGLISSKQDKRKLIPYIKAHKLIVRRSPGYEDEPKVKSWIVGQVNNKKGVDAIYNLLKKKNNDWDKLGSEVVSQRPNTEYHTKLGRLLGYSEEDINFAHNAWEKMRQAKRDSSEYTNHFNPRRIKESPDFGYSHYINKEDDLKRIEFEILDRDYYFVISAILDHQPAAFGKFVFQSDRKIVRVADISLDTTWGNKWGGTGLGQMLYDKAIEYSKKKGYKFFRSDQEFHLSNAAHKAWARLSKRYHVTKLKNGQYQIDLCTINN